MIEKKFQESCGRCRKGKKGARLIRKEELIKAIWRLKHKMRRGNWFEGLIVSKLENRSSSFQIWRVSWISYSTLIWRTTFVCRSKHAMYSYLVLQTNHFNMIRTSCVWEGRTLVYKKERNWSRYYFVNNEKIFMKLSIIMCCLLIFTMTPRIKLSGRGSFQ